MQGLLEKFEGVVNERHFGGSGELGNDLVEKIWTISRTSMKSLRRYA